jgi:hypothetical protein
VTAHTVFCSASDRNVSLIPRSADWTWRVILDNRPQGSVACMDHGSVCTGTLCPFFAEMAGAGDIEQAVRPARTGPN